MLNKQQIKEFVAKELLSGEELHFVSKIEEPKFDGRKYTVGLVTVIVLSILAAIAFESLAKLEDPNRFFIAGCICGAIIVLYILWGLIFYKKSTRRVVSISNLRFIIYEYKKGLHKLNDTSELQDYSGKEEIPFEAIESMKLTEGKSNEGLLAMLFDQEDETMKSRMMAKLHLEIDDCKALRESIPERLRPEGSKEDFWQRTYDD